MRRRYQNGFTLIELIMVIMIMGIVSAIIGGILLNSYQTFQTAKNIGETDWQGFIALQRMTDEIRSIRSANDISTASTSQLSFTDINGSAVTYQLSGNNLLRNSQTLASGIQSLSFGYLNSAGGTAATTALVRYITISITAVNGNLAQSYATMSAARGMS